MRMSRLVATAVAGLALTAAGAVAPATAAVVPSSATMVVTTLPTVVNRLPMTVNAVISTKKYSRSSKKAHQRHKPHMLHRQQTAHFGSRTYATYVATHPAKASAKHRVKHGVKGAVKHPAHRRPPGPRSTASSRSGHATVAPRTGPISTTGAPTSPAPVRPRHDRDVFAQMTGAVQTVFTLVGWNLLALIPMAGIVFAISRQIKSARSASAGHKAV